MADDLTGANDTGVQFAEAGWVTTLRRRPASGGDARADDTAVAVSTDCRAAEDGVARQRTTAACGAGPTAGTELTYLKIDSTMRGSVAAQVAGALDARRDRREDAFVVLCPAYPEMGRTVVDGEVLVDGEPVTASPAGNDPVTPVRHSALTALVPGAVSCPVHRDAEGWREALVEAARGADVVAVDAHGQDDLDLLARTLAGLGDRVVVAGSAGLAAPLARHWHSGTARAGARPAPAATGRSLVVVSSHHRSAREQARLLGELPGVAVVATTAEGLSEAVPVAPSDDWVVLVSPERRGDLDGVTVARELARWAASWLLAGTPPFAHVVLVGGDGAEAVLGALDADGIALRGRLLEGVPDGTLVGGPADGLRVVTKAGGFGAADTLLALHARMTEDHPDTEESS